MLDCAPVHLSAEFRSRMKLELGHIRMVFVAAGFTSILQPLDRSAMRPAKAWLRRRVALEFARELLKAEDPQQYVFDFSTSAQKLRYPGWLQELMTHLQSKAKVNTHGWAFLYRQDRAETLRLAHRSLERGDLFRKFRGDVAPEIAEVHEMEEVDIETESCHEGEELFAAEHDAQEEAEEEEEEQEQEEEVPAEGEPRGSGDAAAAPPPPPVLRRPNEAQTRRLLALRLVYGAKPASAAELDQLA